MKPDFNKIAGNDHPSLPISALFGEEVLEALYDQTKKIMWSVVEFKELKMLYSCAIKEMQTKIDILSTEFDVLHHRNPIASVQARLKTTESIVKKLTRLGLMPTIENLEKYINDFAGIRVICSYIDDIYALEESLLKQDDIKLIKRKDYIKEPKPNGYRSLHLILSVPVFFAKVKKDIKVEVQIRTIAMDFWASLEHQMKYKSSIPERDDISNELKECAEIIAGTDQRMLDLRRRIEKGDDAPTEEELLLERLSKLDVPIL